MIGLNAMQLHLRTRCDVLVEYSALVPLCLELSPLVLPVTFSSILSASANSAFSILPCAASGTLDAPCSTASPVLQHTASVTLKHKALLFANICMCALPALLAKAAFRPTSDVFQGKGQQQLSLTH